MKKFTYLLGCLLLSGLTACLRPDSPIDPYQAPGDVEIVTIPMADEAGRYDYEIYYDLGTGSSTVVPRTIWDIGIEAPQMGEAIILNSANFMFAYNTGTTDFDGIGPDLTRQSGFRNQMLKADDKTGDLSKTAISQEEGEVVVIDLGRGDDEALSAKGYIKAVFNRQTSGEVQVTWSDLDGSNLQNATITPDPTLRFTCFSFETSSVVEVQPHMEEWDLVFGYYTTFFEPSASFPDGLHYWVTGVRNNWDLVTAGQIDSTYSWETFTLQDTAQVNMIRDVNEIGYDWKQYLFEPPPTGTFVVFPEMVYIVRDTDGFYYKLRFQDFYSESGVKGFPTFEYQQL
ncbi:MAG: HmuY family protein [Bacteroidota bacterium]